MQSLFVLFSFVNIIFFICYYLFSLAFIFLLIFSNLAFIDFDNNRGSGLKVKG
jgi:hypothetical protein